MSPEHSLPDCSLIISTYNWPEALSACIATALQQEILPTEILIADDGSRDETKKVVEDWKAKSKVPIIHCWHPDTGFRLCTIRNEAIKRAKYPYIIQIDGDILMHRKFIGDHLKSAVPGAFLCGSRVSLTEKVNLKRLSPENPVPGFTQIPFGFLFNNMRITSLSRRLARTHYYNSYLKLRGCNMSFWKKDLLAVNGYNEDITGWAPEDKEIAVRLINAGINRRSLKFMGIAYHLFHNTVDKSRSELNKGILQNTIDSGISWTPNGIVKSATRTVNS